MHHPHQWPQQFLTHAHPASSRQTWANFPLTNFPPTPPESVTETHMTQMTHVAVATPSPRTSDSGSPADVVENNHGHNHNHSHNLSHNHNTSHNHNLSNSHPYNMMPYWPQMQYAPFADFHGPCRLPTYQSPLYHTTSSAPQEHQWMFMHQQNPGLSLASRPSLTSSRPSTLSSPVETPSCRRSKLCSCAGCRDPPRRPRPIRRHSCPYPNCTKEYSKTSHLRAHERWHRNERPYVCSFLGCGKSFTRSDELSRHIRSHTGDKKFVCAKCEKKFVRSDHLKKHSKVHDDPASTRGKIVRRKGSMKRAAKAPAVSAPVAAVLTGDTSTSQPSPPPQMLLRPPQYNYEHLQLPASISLYSIKENGMHDQV